MYTKAVRHIRAVLFRIIYYWSALSEPSCYVLVKQFITFLFSWGKGAAPSPANFVVKVVTGVDGWKCNWQHSMAHPWKPPYRRKNLAKISYARWVIANFVQNFVAMATGVGRGKTQLAAFDGPSPKPPYRRKNLLRKPSYSQFWPKFCCHGNGGQSGKNALAAFDGPSPKTPL